MCAAPEALTEEEPDSLLPPLTSEGEARSVADLPFGHDVH